MNVFRKINLDEDETRILRVDYFGLSTVVKAEACIIVVHESRKFMCCSEKGKDRLELGLRGVSF